MKTLMKTAPVRADGLTAEQVAKDVRILLSNCKRSITLGVGTFSFDKDNYAEDIVNFVVETLREQFSKVSICQENRLILITIKV